MAAMLALALFPASSAQSPRPAPPSPPRDGGGTGLLFGQNYSLGLKAPDGWVLDNQAGAQKGFAAVFYPQGSSWEAADPVISVHIWQKRSGQTLESIMADDLAAFRKHFPGMVAEDRPGIRTALGASAKVRFFRCGDQGTQEMIVFFDEAKVVVMLTLSARTPAQFEAALEPFRRLLDSYRFAGELRRTPLGKE